MKRTISMMTLPAALAAAALFATPALAQQRDNGRGRGDRQSEGRATERAQPRNGNGNAGVAPRAESRREPIAPQVNAPRYEQRTGPGYQQRSGPRYEQGYGQRYEPRYEPRYAPRYAPRYEPFWESRGYYRPYVFRPRFSIGFGIFAGFPVPYTYAYPYPYAVGRPPASYYGGVVLEISPEDAAVYVDGAYAGIVGDFDGQRQPLTLTAGRHRIEVQEQGLAPLVVDVMVQPGQVIPYRGDLRPY
jgi:hypothetical protein